MHTILVTGSNGLIGSAIKDYSEKDNSYNYIFKNKNELDIYDIIKLLNFFKNNRINYVINCAAYTNISDSELQKELMMNTNFHGIKNLLDCSLIFNFKIINYSSDYVYDGKKKHPYLESDNAKPLSSYGKSKLLADSLLLEYASNSLTIRTSWVYGDHEKSFTNKVIELSNNSSVINMVDDQIGSPTYVDDLVRVTFRVLKNENKWDGQVYNFCNTGSISWYKFAIVLKKALKLELIINPISSLDIDSNVIRPSYSVLNCDKIREKFLIKTRNFEEAFECYIKKLGS